MCSIVYVGLKRDEILKSNFFLEENISKLVREMQLESFRQRKIDKYMKNWFKVKKYMLVCWLNGLINLLQAIICQKLADIYVSNFLYNF